MRPGGTLLWREIEEALQLDIASGVYPAGSRLPIESDLATRFGVNRHTVRRALSELQDRGAISIEQGRGMFVRAPKLVYPIGERTRFTENIASLNLAFSGRLLRSWETPASAALARDLGIAEGIDCLALDDLREIDGEPVCLTTHYFPARRFAGLAEVFAEVGSITVALRHFGINDYKRRQTRIHARGATLEEAAVLRQSGQAPVLVVESINVDEAGVPIEYGCSRSAGGRFELVCDTPKV